MKPFEDDPIDLDHIIEGFKNDLALRDRIIHDLTSENLQLRYELERLRQYSKVKP